MLPEVVKLYDKVELKFLELNEKAGLFKESFVGSMIIAMKLAISVLDCEMLDKWLQLVPRYLPMQADLSGICGLHAGNFEFDTLGFFLG